ncbi:MAG: hypothetical protein FWF15_06795 [Oscillospiraceae bacterium]|nr:hypothetical protein [Oscillospiraceae bacterium]
MLFDKNQSEFPSDFHREVWWWAVGLVPPEVSLTAAVKEKCTSDVLEGCYQWYAYFNELCEDMYANAELYTPFTARQYRDTLESIALNRKIKDADCLTPLERTGLNPETLINEKYPQMIHAMATMEQSPNMRKTPGRHHFAHCEFRQLFKSYSPNYDELLRRVSDESLEIAHAIHAFAKSLKIERYVHFDTIKYKYKTIRVLDFTVTGKEYPTLRVNIGTQINPGARTSINPFKGDLDRIFDLIAARKNSIDQFFLL